MPQVTYLGDPGLHEYQDPEVTVAGVRLPRDVPVTMLEQPAAKLRANRFFAVSDGPASTTESDAPPVPPAPPGAGEPGIDALGDTKARRKG